MTTDRARRACRIELYEWEDDCFSFTPGACWAGDNYFLPGRMMLPVAVANHCNRQGGEDPLTEWCDYLENNHP